MSYMEIARSMTESKAELDKAVRQLQMVDNNLATLDSRTKKSVEDEKKSQTAAFDAKQAKALQDIDAAIAKRRQGAVNIIAKAVDKGTPGFIGREEMDRVVKDLKEILPPDLVENYNSQSARELKDDKEAYRAYSFLDRFVGSNGGGTFMTKLFSSIIDLLVDVTEENGHAGVVALVLALMPLVLTIFLPFVLPAFLVVLIACGAVNGFVSHMALQRLYSVKVYMCTEYDEELFEHDKTDLMEQVDTFLAECKEESVKRVMAVPFKLNGSKIVTIEKKAAEEKDLLTKQHNNFKELVDQYTRKIEQLNQQLEQEKAAKAKQIELFKKQRFEELSWDKEWSDTLVFNIGENNSIEPLRYCKGNTLYILPDGDTLTEFMQLVIYQTLLTMHPNFNKTIVLDYKYMGGKLIQMCNISKNMFTMTFDDSVGEKVNALAETVLGRVTTILSSSPNLEAFNELMKTYEAPGEAYYTVHVASLDSMSKAWETVLRNGPKVGYFTKLYVTLPELRKLGKDFPVTFFEDAYEVGEHLVPRPISMVQRMLAQAK